MLYWYILNKFGLRIKVYFDTKINLKGQKLKLENLKMKERITVSSSVNRY